MPAFPPSTGTPATATISLRNHLPRFPHQRGSIRQVVRIAGNDGDQTPAQEMVSRLERPACRNRRQPRLRSIEQAAGVDKRFDPHRIPHDLLVSFRMAQSAILTPCSAKALQSGRSPNRDLAVLWELERILGRSRDVLQPEVVRLQKIESIRMQPNLPRQLHLERNTRQPSAQSETGRTPEQAGEPVFEHARVEMRGQDRARDAVLYGSRSQGQGLGHRSRAVIDALGQEMAMKINHDSPIVAPLWHGPE